MNRIFKWTAPALTLTLLLGLTARTLADDAAAKGSVTGTVTGMDGKPAADVMVKLVVPPTKADRKAEKASGEHKKVTPVATATTDKDGKYEMKDVPAGDYAVQAGSKSAGMGREMVSVKAGEAATADVTLKAAPDKKKKSDAPAAPTDTK